jgi:hypothetical protein
MTPHELYQTYRNLNVDLPDGRTIFGLDIHKYRINTPDGGPVIGTVDGLSAYHDLLAKVAKSGVKRTSKLYSLDVTDDAATQSCSLFRKIEWIDTTALQRPFVGKGSPEEIRQALRLAVFFKLVGSTKSELQSYCDKNIGLDCSGFAGNLYEGDWRDKSANYFRDNGIEVKRLEDVRANDAICWVNDNHIVVIDRVYPANKCLTKGDPVIQCMAAESTAAQMLRDGPMNGLSYTEYSFLPPSQVPFKILRQKITTTQIVDFWTPKIKIVRIQ